MKNVIITVLSIAVIGLGGYLVFDKVIDKKDNNVKDNNKVEENINKDNDNDEEGDYSLEKAKELMETYVNQSTSEIFDGLNSKLKLKIAYQNLNYSTYPDTISYEEMNKIYKDFFGNEDAAKESFVPNVFPCDSYVFDLTQNSYVYKHSNGCGGAPWYVNYFVKSATIKKSNLDIVVYYYEIDSGMGNLYRYRTKEEKQSSWQNIDDYKIADLNRDERIDFSKLTDEAFEKYKDKMDTFTFRFEKYNDSYVLKDVFKN